MAFLRDLLSRLKNEPAVDYTNFYLETGGDPGFVAADTQYVRIWLRAARVVDVRRWTSKFFATVHARFTHADRSAGQQELVSVVAPDKSFEAMDPTHLDRLIVVNQPLLGPIPYRGELSMEVALFSVAAVDLAKPYLELLSGLTDTASVAFLTQVKPFVEPIRRGAELLFKGEGAQLEIGLARTDTQLRTGNMVVARVPKGSLSPSSVRLDPNDFRLLDREGRALTGFPYLVLGVEASTVRPDYAKIPEIREGWNAVREAAATDRQVEEVRERFGRLRRRVWLSADLVQTDKKRIVEIFNREITEAGYDVAAPRELATLEAAPSVRPLRDVELLLEPATVEQPMGRGLEALAAAPGRISVAELQRMMRDPDVPAEVLKQYFMVNPETSRPFSPSIIPDPSRVDVAPPADALEGAMLMGWANGWCRLRRQEKFKRRAAQGDRRAVLVSEGDSWFQFPIFLEDVIDNLLAEFNIWSVDAAGDTLQNMVVENAEYMRALRRHEGSVKAFLFSGGGNDIVGEDESGRAIVAQVIKPFEAGRPPEWYLETEALAHKLRFIEDCYRAVIRNVAAEFPGLPVICHGYDYAVPGGSPDDPRNPFWAKKDQWIGRAMREELKITDPLLQRTIVRLMIDRFNERIRSLCGGNNMNGAFRNAWHVDVRGTVGSNWADELHPTDPGYRLVSAKFIGVVRRALGGAEADMLEEERSPNGPDDADVDPEERAPVWPREALEGAAPWRVASALKQLRLQVDARFPTRSRKSDGTIGDAAHANRSSDHNPWVQAGGMGVVTAMDFTHDLASGCTGDWLAEALRAGRDARIKYIIWHRRICSSSGLKGLAAWEWRPYAGANPHDHHLHLSVRADPAQYDSQEPWRL